MYRVTTEVKETSGLCGESKSLRLLTMHAIFDCGK